MKMNRLYEGLICCWKYALSPCWYHNTILNNMLYDTIITLKFSFFSYLIGIYSRVLQIFANREIFSKKRVPRVLNFANADIWKIFACIKFRDSLNQVFSESGNIKQEKDRFCLKHNVFDVKILTKYWLYHYWLRSKKYITYKILVSFIFENFAFFSLFKKFFVCI